MAHSITCQIVGHTSIILILILYPFFTFQFPDCSDDQAISVACLDLQYYVSVAMEAQMKNEENDTFSPLTLSDLKPEVDVNRRSTEPSDRQSKG